MKEPTTIGMDEARANLTAIGERAKVAGERFRITRSGNGFFGIVTIATLEAAVRLDDALPEIEALLSTTTDPKARGALLDVMRVAGAGKLADVIAAEDEREARSSEGKETS